MNETGYNGWVNYETWAVKLWLDNERASYEEVTSTAADLYREALDGAENDAEKARESASYEMAGYLKAYVDDLQDILLPDLPASLFSDLLAAALAEVDWHEIAEAYISDAAEA